MWRSHFLLPVLCFFAFNTYTQAQVWLEIGPKATFGPSGYFNSTLASDDQHDYTLNLSFNYGAVVGLNIGDYHGFNIEALWGTYFQDLVSFENPIDNSNRFERNSLEWEVADLYALYRYYPESGMYLELGPKYTFVRELSQTLGSEVVDTKGQYEDNYVSGVVGLGAFLSGSETMVFKAGLRVEYGLTDFVSPDGMSNNFPANYSSTVDLANTVPYRVSFGLELSFGVGGIAKGACGRRGFVLGSRYR